MQKDALSRLNLQQMLLEPSCWKMSSPMCT